MNKRILIFLLLLLLVCVMPLGMETAQANSADFDAHDTGKGVAILQYLGKDKNVIIPAMIDGKTVTQIFPFAFHKRELTSVVIPETVTTIGQGAFMDNKLTKLHIPNSVTVIESSAFKNNKITELTIPSNVKVLKAFAFENNQLTTVTFQEGVQEIASAAFANNKLTAVTFPASLQTLGDNAFGGNHLFEVTFKGALELAPQSIGLMESLQGALVGWYTDKTFKNKWNGKITGPTTIYPKWKLTEYAKKVAIDNLSGDRVKLTKLEKGYTYTLYKDAELQQKLTAFTATDIERVLTVKQIGQSAGHVYVTVTEAGFASAPEKVAYKAARTPNLAKSNVTVKYTKNKSTIQLKNLKVGTTYTIFRDSSQKVKIVSFKATKTNSTITTNKLLKNSGPLYITTQQPNLRISTVGVACYPKTHLCPNEALPSGATIAATHKEYVTFKYNYKLPGGGTITQVKVFSYDNVLSIHFEGYDRKNKHYLLWTKNNNGFGFMGNKPILTDDALAEMQLIDARFKALFK